MLQLDWYPFLLYKIAMKEYVVVFNQKALKGREKLGLKERKVLSKLITDLRTSGPIQPSYPNYSSLGNNRYHCHLSYHWVACLYSEKGKLKIEVYYVGSRESAPY